MNELTTEVEARSALLTIDENSEFPISGRELHERLNIGTAYKDWFPRMCEFGFEEGKDFCSKMSESTGGRRATNHMLSMDMAKHIAMVQRTDEAKKIRQYLIDTEKAWNSPEWVMSRALKIADRTIASLKDSVERLQTENTIMLPKAEYFDDLVDRATNLNFRTVAKEFGVKERWFIGKLQSHGFIYKDSHGQNVPYAEKNTGLFVVKECKGFYSKWAGVQTFITPKGRETFRLLVKKWKEEE